MESEQFSIQHELPRAGPRKFLAFRAFLELFWDTFLVFRFGYGYARSRTRNRDLLIEYKKQHP
jgi:hypothetical protein